MPRRPIRRQALVALLVVPLAACGERDAGNEASLAGQSGGAMPDELPLMLNTELPFRYPADLYERKVQGNTTLSIYIDSLGAVRPESTRVVETSGYPSLDSAAVAGSRELRFRPARLGGRSLAVPVLFPVYFRHPDAAPLPGDTILQGRGTRDEGRAVPRP